MIDLEHVHLDELDLIKKIMHKELVEENTVCLCNDSSIARAIDIAKRSQVDPVIELYVEILQVRPFSDYNKRIAIRILRDRYDVPEEILHDTVNELTEFEFEDDNERQEYLKNLLASYRPYVVHDHDHLEGLNCILCKIADETEEK